MRESRSSFPVEIALAFAATAAIAATVTTACGCASGGARAASSAGTPSRATPIAYSPFVRVEGTQFTLRGTTFHDVGANFWAAMNLGSRGPGGDRARLVRELDRLRAMGVRSVRILGASEGPDSEPYRVVPSMQKEPGRYDDDVVDGLDFAIAELKKRDMVAVVCLNDTWPWSGGMAAYLQWHGAPRPPYPMEPPYDWGAWQDYVVKFYGAADALADYRRHVAFVIGRKNPYTGVAYRDEPAIMAWEIANEPRGGKHPAALVRFLDETARFIKSLDPNHLVTTGSEGTTEEPDGAGLDFVRDHASRFIDYATFHFWAQNWGHFDPKRPETYAAAEAEARRYVAEHVAMGARLGKPVVLEEFGLARDGGSFDPQSTVTLRDRFYGEVMADVVRRAARAEGIASVSFWAWSGEARPADPGGMWTPGAPLTGDPPHEPQGWYGVYDTDASTLRVIADHASRMHALDARAAP